MMPASLLLRGKNYSTLYRRYFRLYLGNINTMKTLYLLRHAHAEPRPTAYADFDRPLNERGREEAEAVAEYCQTKELTFDFIMCSAALRAQETAEPLRPIASVGGIEISEKFYNIPEDHILNHLKRIPHKAETVLYVGHNPGLAFTILRLAQSLPDFLKDGVEPATLVGFQLSIDKWEELNWGVGEIIDVFHPTLVPTGAPAPEGS